MALEQTRKAVAALTGGGWLCFVVTAADKNAGNPFRAGCPLTRQISPLTPLGPRRGENLPAEGASSAVLPKVSNLVLRTAAENKSGKLPATPRYGVD